MGALLDILLVAALYLEVAVLFYFEKKAWGTLYTPLNFLMLPYAIILLLSICIAGHGGFIPFTYSSIFVWIVGLAVFSIPSFLFGFAYSGTEADSGRQDECAPNGLARRKGGSGERFPSLLFFLGLALCALFILHFRSILAHSNNFVGSDDFAEDFSGHGVWAHLRMMLVPLLILSIYFADRRHWYLWFLIVPTILLMFINQVKGWIVIPLIAGCAMRLYAGKMKLSLKLILSVITGGALVFLISYAFLPVLGKQGTVTSELYEFVFSHFVSYLTAGVMGFSQDTALGYPDCGNFEILISQFVNLAKSIVGDKELLSPVNNYYLQISTDVSAAPSNVRTLFGTIYIYTNVVSFILYTLVLSTTMYLLKVWAMSGKNIYIKGVFFFECSLLAMGWFEFYFFHLTVIEIPIFFIVYSIIASFFSKRAQKPEVVCQNCEAI